MKEIAERRKRRSGSDHEQTPLMPAESEDLESPGKEDVEKRYGRKTSTNDEAKSALSPYSPEGLVDAAATSVRALAENAIKAKNNMKKSPWIFSLVIGVASVGVVAAGIFGTFTTLLTFRVVGVVLKLYQIGFGCLCFVIEVSRHYSIFGIRPMVRRWCPVFELTLGRGALQMLTGGLAMAGDFDIGETIPGGVLFVCGVFNCAWGINSARRVKQLFTKLKEEVEAVGSGAVTEAGNGGVHDTQKGVLLIQRKFQALDLNQDGRLSKEELELGCKSLNISLDEGDLDMIFQLLDPKGKGYIGIDDFELWWYSAKDPLSYLV